MEHSKCFVKRTPLFILEINCLISCNRSQKININSPLFPFIYKDRFAFIPNGFPEISFTSLSVETLLLIDRAMLSLRSHQEPSFAPTSERQIGAKEKDSLSCLCSVLLFFAQFYCSCVF